MKQRGEHANNIYAGGTLVFYLVKYYFVYFCQLDVRMSSGVVEHVGNDASMPPLVLAVLSTPPFPLASLEYFL